MKNFLTLAITTLGLCLIGNIAMGQNYWSPNGSNIYNNNGGKVGISTAGVFAPSQHLHMYEPAGVTNLLLEGTVSGSAGGIGNMFVKNASDGALFGFFFKRESSNTLAILSAFDGSTWYEFNRFDLTTQKLVYTSGVDDVEFSNSGDLLFMNTGYVGIGEANPSTALAVNGTITCREVEVTLSGWSDFVFEKNYALLSLYELENYIKTNKHLPGVPSALEVKEEGIKLGQMDAVLLQKIEELTLYLIDLKKENEALKTRIEKLEK